MCSSTYLSVCIPAQSHIHKKKVYKHEAYIACGIINYTDNGTSINYHSMKEDTEEACMHIQYNRNQSEMATPSVANDICQIQYQDWWPVFKMWEHE